MSEGFGPDATMVADPDTPPYPVIESDEDRRKRLIAAAAQLSSQQGLAIPDAIYNMREPQSSGGVVERQSNLEQRDPHAPRHSAYDGLKVPQYETIPNANFGNTISHAGLRPGIITALMSSGSNEEDIRSAQQRNLTRHQAFQDEMSLRNAQEREGLARNVYGSQRPVVGADPDSPTGYSYFHGGSGENMGVAAPSPIKPAPAAKTHAPNIYEQAVKMIGEQGEDEDTDSYNKRLTNQITSLSKATHAGSGGSHVAGAGANQYIQYEDDKGNVYSNDKKTNTWYNAKGQKVDSPPAGIHRIGTRGPGGSDQAVPDSILSKATGPDGTVDQDAIDRQLTGRADAQLRHGGTYKSKQGAGNQFGIAPPAIGDPNRPVSSFEHDPTQKTMKDGTVWSKKTGVWVQIK